jgi:hypothetical protein
MNRFAEILQRTSDRLDLPQPARSRVLLEIAADMEDVYAVQRERGLDEADAVREAIESCDLSDGALAELTRVHRGPIRRALDRISSRAVRHWERLLLFILVASACYTGGWLTQGTRVVRDAGPFAWPVLLGAVVASVVAIAKFYQLYLKQDHRWRGLRRGLSPLLGIAVFLVFLGFTGSWLEALKLAGKSVASEREIVPHLLQWALQATALLQLSLGLAVLIALAWFGLAGKVGQIENYEAELLLRTE